MVTLRSIVAAIATFSAIPVPTRACDTRSLRYLLWSFPLLGVFCSGLWWLVALIPMPSLLRGTLFFIGPLLLTGGIHLDGYLDTYDALASQGSVERRNAILHDPHSGAFALIHLMIYGLASEACCLTFEPSVSALGCLGAGFVLSRALSAWSLAWEKTSTGSVLARRFAEEVDRGRLRWFSTFIAACAIATQTFFADITGLVVGASALLTVAWCLRVARRKFEGLSGDLCGWLLVKCEFWQLLTFTLLQWWYS